MFYLQYLKAELVRRWGKTITMVTGLAIASAIIISIISISQGLSSAQNSVLNPLQNVGTDIIVSRSVDTENFKNMDQTTRDEVMNASHISTDLSKLGKPGASFTNDTFLPGTSLTFASTVISKLDSTLVKDYSSGLILNVTHQSGKIPKVTSTFKTGGDTLDVNGTISGDDMRKAFDEAQTKAMAELKAKGIDPNSSEGRQALREAMRANMPEGIFRGQIKTPEKTYTQDVGPISTDIQTESYTVAGIDTSKTDIGLILPSQITSGKYFNGKDQIVINQTFAKKKSLKVGDKFTLGKKSFSIVGLVDPKLYTNTADLYLPLSDLQTLSGKKALVNILLVKSTNNTNIPETSKKMSALFAGAKVTDSSTTAKQVSGSLVSAANLTNRFIGITSIIVILAAFIIVSLLTLLSVNKRTREIGTLKAIGWRNSTIIRQILLENISVGFIGAVVGVGLGLLGILIINNFNISLSATIANSDVGQGFMRRFGGSESSGIQANIDLKTSASIAVLALGAGIALLGSVFSGGLAAFKSSRMRAQDALRNLE